MKQLLKGKLRVLLSLIAFDIPVYREIFSRLLSAFSPLCGISALRIENCLRGMTYKNISNHGQIQVGRYVILNQGLGKITLARGVIINNYCYLTTDRDGGYILIGENSHVDVLSALHGQGGISIGKNCAIASGVIIYSQSNQYNQNETIDTIEMPIIFNQVVIEDGVWIGANATILPGVRIGRGAVIGAGALVNKSIEPYEIAVGVPARSIGIRNQNRGMNE